MFKLFTPSEVQANFYLTMVQGGGWGKGLLMKPLLGFGGVTIFEKIVPLLDSLGCALQDEVYIMGLTLLGARDVIQNGTKVAAILDFIQN